MMRRLDWRPITSVCVVAEEYGVGAEDDEEVGLEADHVRLRGGGGVEEDVRPQRVRRLHRPQRNFVKLCQKSKLCQTLKLCQKSSKICCYMIGLRARFFIERKLMFQEKPVV